MWLNKNHVECALKISNASYLLMYFSVDLRKLVLQNIVKYIVHSVLCFVILHLYPCLVLLNYLTVKDS